MEASLPVESFQAMTQTDIDTDLKTWLFKDVKSSTQLEIVRSELPEAGNGVITQQKISAGEEVFRVMETPFRTVENVRFADTCDYCLRFSGSLVHDSGRFVESHAMRFSVRRCAGCKLLSYCSEVNTPIITWNVLRVTQVLQHLDVCWIISAMLSLTTMA